MLFYVLLIGTSIFVTTIIIKLIYNMLRNTHAIRENYLGEKIPVGMGIVFPISYICIITILSLFYPLGETPYIFLFGIVSISFLGLIDDLLGNRNTTGLKGHIGKLFQLQLTTGGLKAVMGGIIAIVVMMPFGNNIFITIFNGVIIALSTNLINLLDLRPGRAIKGYFIFAFILLAFFYNTQYIYLLLILTILTIVYFPIDVKAKAMMGDTGSNALGFTLGFFTAISATILVKIIVLIFLITIHFYAERASITDFITKNRVLNFIDELGR